MGELIFIGLGLHDEAGISLRGLNAARSCDVLFAEFYTSVMRGLNLANLEQMVGRKVQVLSRLQVEEDPIILSTARANNVGFLVPGDPLVATTHIGLRLRAEKNGIRTRVVHAASVSSAVAGATGLESYKFGRTVTMPVAALEKFPESVYVTIRDNLRLGLHSLILLEIDVEKRRHVTISEAVRALLNFSRITSDGIINERSLTVGVARVESSDMFVEAGSAEDVAEVDFGEPPHILIFPGRLHFVEAEALEVLCHAPRELVNERTQ